MEYENQIRQIENGKQIGCCNTTDENILIQCGIQKKDHLYLVYFFEGNISEDPFGENGNCKEEFYSFSNLESAIEFITSRNFSFNKFKPQKGNKIFNAFHNDFTPL